MGVWVFLHKQLLDWVLLFTVMIHVLAVIKHHFYDREPAIFGRMWGR